MEKVLLQGGKSKDCLMGLLGIQAYYPYKYEEMIQDLAMSRALERQNIMLEYKLRASYRAGYWEVLFFHTNALSQIPEDMRR